MHRSLTAMGSPLIQRNMFQQNILDGYWEGDKGFIFFPTTGSYRQGQIKCLGVSYYFDVFAT